jgi:hypothetical protein
MTQNQDPNSGTLPDGADITPTDGQETVEGASDVLTLDELNTHLGKNFKDKDAALKSFKDTFSFVGSAGQEKAPQATPQQGPGEQESYDALVSARLEKEFFYRDNPEYSEHREFIENLASGSGKKPQEVVESDSFKLFFEKATGYDEVQKSKSVIQSNPRLAASSDKIKEASEQAQSGDRAGAAKKYAGALVESLGL